MVKPYTLPKSAFNPFDLLIMRRSLDLAWREIESSNRINLVKDEALKRALCQKLFSLVRSPPTDSLQLRDLLLDAVSTDPRRESAE
jgi:hypothetical protein